MRKKIVPLSVVITLRSRQLLTVDGLSHGITLYTENEEESSQPLYMCIKIGKKFNLVPGHGGTFVRTRLKAEYWFDIPPDR